MDLRKRTNVGMVECKEALQEAGGDIEEAIHILRKKGVASAVKKSVRETNEGMIGYAEDMRGVALVEINAETDFVVQNNDFKEFVRNVCLDVLHSRAKSVEELCAQKSSTHPALTVEEHRVEIVHKFSENIRIKRLLYIDRGEGQSLGVYSHMGGQSVAVVTLCGSNDAKHLARKIAMHVVAETPCYLNSEEIPDDVIEKEKEIVCGQNQNKPPEIMDKIVQGKIHAFYEQSCLYNQKYVQDPSMNIAKFIASEGGSEIKVVGFVHWQVGG